MESTTRLILPDVAEALRTEPESVVELTDELHPADLAELATLLEDELAVKLVRTLPLDVSARMIEVLERGRRTELFQKLAAEALDDTADLAEKIAPDERADLFGELSEELRGQLLAKMDRAESREVRELLAYPEGTAGALMTTNFVALSATETVHRAIEQVRQSAAEMETIYDAYAVDPNGILLGVVSLRDLVTSPAAKTIAEVMEPNVIAVPDEADQEEVARLIAKYDLFAIPVLDQSRRIVGIITVDDVMDVVQQEATEDVQKLGAVEPLEAGYFQTGFLEFVRKRSLWLIILFIGGFLTGSALKHYDAAVEAMKSLGWFIPLIISSGGNSGSQSASLMIRALAVGEVRPRDFGRIIARELVIGVSLGLVLCIFGVARVMMWDETRTVNMAVTVGLSVIAVVALGAVVGAGLPLILKRLGLDPAVASTPFIASLSDVLGLIIYFEIARALVF
jgi:magnesium transporter